MFSLIPTYPSVLNSTWLSHFVSLYRVGLAHKQARAACLLAWALNWLAGHLRVMAAGIGEASAILTVAQLGISLSKSLITYIEEVKGAPAHIQRIGNEILTTSERLKDIGELVSQNSQTKVFNEEGINSAVRCSTECQQIIQDLRIVLCKGGWQDHPKESDKDVVDTSLFSTLRWPFIKIKLEVPRAELHRIKIDLSLLFSAAMVLKA